MTKKAQGRILIVEDEAALRDLFRESLEEWESCPLTLVIDEAADGFEGLAKLHTHVYDLVITDMQMPKLDGKQMIEAMRNQEGPNKNSPCLIISGNPQYYESELDKPQYGQVLALDKPVEIERLIRNCRILLVNKIRESFAAA